MAKVREQPLEEIVVAIVEHGDKILVGRKVGAEGHFFDSAWHIPSGHVEPGESDEQAVVREVREEAGIAVRVRGLLATRRLPELGYHVRWYLCVPLSLEVRPGSDLAEVAFVQRAEALQRFPDRARPTWPAAVEEYFGIAGPDQEAGGEAGDKGG